MELQNYKEYKGKAFAISSLLYALFLFALIFFEIVYEKPEDEVALGVDLNYGIDLTGYGDIQTTNKASDSKNDYDVKPADEATKTQKVTAKPTPPVKEPTPIKKTTTTKAKEVLTSEAEKTPVVMKKTPEKKAASNPAASQPAPAKAKPAPVAPPRAVDQGSVMKKSGSGSKSNGTTGTRDGIGGNSNGDGKPGAIGDQGDPRGTPDGKSLYGTPGKGGGTGGASVSIAGWNKKSFSLPKDQTAETGRIEFNVTVDDRGEVVLIVTKRSTVSPSVTNFYKNYIQRNLGKYLTAQGTPPPRSSGTITINITN